MLLWSDGATGEGRGQCDEVMGLVGRKDVFT